MRANNYIFRLGAFLRHFFTSWNTTGEGIHSPSLFYLVRMLFYEPARYYCWADIEQQRQRLLRSSQSIFVDDFGTGTSGNRLVSTIARTSLESRNCAQLLFRLLVHLRHELDRPLTVVELGTSLGITTSYLASAASDTDVFTYEGSPAIAEQAQQVWKKLVLTNIQCIQGDINQTLPHTLYNYARVDVAFLDANHTRKATLQYFNQLRQRALPSSVFVIDDIHYSREMQEAWDEIKNMTDVTTTMDFYHFGLVFFDPHLWKRHYRLRI